LIYLLLFLFFIYLLIYYFDSSFVVDLPVKVFGAA
jgi:hypothetical protein